jgi:ferrous iron transport protein A
VETTFVFIICVHACFSAWSSAAISAVDLPIRPPADSTMPNTETLDQIPNGRFVRVVGVVGDDPIARRLNDLGIRKGVQIEVIRQAPLGDPTVFELCGYQLCLRRTESARIQVSSSGETARSTPPATRQVSDP